MIAQLMETVRTLSDRLDGLTPGGRTERSRTRQRSPRHREEHREHRRRPAEGVHPKGGHPSLDHQFVLDHQFMQLLVNPVRQLCLQVREPRRRLKGLPKGV